MPALLLTEYCCPVGSTGGYGASVNNIITIDPSLYSDLSDGTFEIFGFNNSIGSWGSNRAILTIETAPVPEPTTMFLLGSGLIGLAGFRRKIRKRRQ